jgi:hypothetical protein
MANVGQQDSTHAAALRKNPEYESDELLDTVRDARPLTEEELDGDTLRFFLPNPSRNEVLRNYVSNPLPGGNEKRFLAMGFHPLSPIIEDVSGVDPLSLMNALADAGVILKKQNGRETVLRAQLRQYMPQIDFDLEYAAVDDGTNSNSTTELFAPSKPLVQLPDPGEKGNTDHDFTLEFDEQFELEIVFADEGAIPAQADLEIYMGAFLQLVPAIG